MTANTMTSLARDAALRFGARTALAMVDSGESASFIDIEERSAGYAGGLAAAGIGRGDRVAVYLPNSVDWVVAYHAIARLGGVVVPTNILLSPAEVAYIVADSEAVALALPLAKLDAINAAMAADTRSVLRIVHDGEAAGPNAIASGTLRDAPAFAPVTTAPDDLFTIGYTSGTTGRPKGATQTHRAVSYNIAMTSTIHVRGPHDRVLSALPFPHVYGNIVLNSGFLTGLTVFSASRFDPGMCLKAIAEHGVTLFEGVPTMYYQMLQHPDIERADLSSVTRCTVGGQSMPVAYIEEVVRRFGCPMLELWGMTELAGLGVTHSPYWPPRYGSIGLPFPRTEIRIADLEDGSKDAPDGAAGELCVRGPCVTRGYWKNPGATAETIDGAGFLATGDIAVRDAEGYVTIVDRRKGMIITAGYNIYPAEVEQAIASHPAVAMVAVGPVPDAEKGELPKAYIVRRADAVCEAADIISHCRQHLAGYKVPRLVSFVSDLPKTSTGKIMRRALRDLP
jgi:long-chain acyl-CoA synthetase